MRFSVDAHAIGCHLTGNEVYIRNLLHEFARLDRSSDFIAYVSKPGAHLQVPKSITTSQVSENPFRRLGLDLPMKLRYDQPDLLHVQYTGPLSCSVPLVVSVHDVSYLEHPQYFTRFRSTQLRLTVKRTVRGGRADFDAERIFAARRFCGTINWMSAKWSWCPTPFLPRSGPWSAKSAAAMIEEKFGIRGPFVLTVGDLQPRKNHLGLLHAFEETLRQHPHLPHRLVFVGKETWYSKELHRAVLRSSVAGRVHFTGFVEDPDLLQFYGACDLFVFPSFYEGFGLPILEAMACGRAVACSSATAMPEVANAAGILFDPYSVPEMARAIGDVLLDEEMRVRLERLGTHRAASFTWERAAQRTLDVYYDVAGVK